MIKDVSLEKYYVTMTLDCNGITIHDGMEHDLIEPREKLLTFFQGDTQIWN